MKFRWPLVWRKTFDAAADDYARSLERLEQRHIHETHILVTDRRAAQAATREVKDKLARTEQALVSVGKVASGKHPEYALPVPRIAVRTDSHEDIRMGATVIQLAAKQFAISIAVSDLDAVTWGPERAAMMAGRYGTQLAAEASHALYEQMMKVCPPK